VQAAKVHVKTAVAASCLQTTALNVQETITINQSTIPERSATAVYGNVTQAYVQNTLEQAHALSSRVQDFTASFNASALMWVLAALVLLLFARL
jgi:hypothetical protein